METMVLDQVIDEVKDWQAQHQPFDVMQMLPHYVFQPYQEGDPVAGKLVPLADIPPNVKDAREWRLSPHALTQMLGRLKFPKDFYDRLPSGLQYNTVNWLTQNGGYTKSLLMRAQDDGVLRAIMSADYERFDHAELLELLRPFVTNDAVIRWKARDDMSLHLSFTYPSSETEIKVGRVAETGLHVSNSEVGVRSVTIAAYVYQYWCSNGAISRSGGDFYRLRHTGDGDLMRSAVQSAMTQVYLSGKGVVERMKKAVGITVKDPPKKIQEIGKEAGLTKAELLKSLEAFAKDPGESMFDVSNAFSRAAQEMPQERSYELQRLSVDVLPALSPEGQN